MQNLAVLFEDGWMLLIFSKVSNNLLLLNVYNVAHKQIWEKDMDGWESTNGTEKEIGWQHVLVATNTLRNGANVILANS